MTNPENSASSSPANAESIPVEFDVDLTSTLVDRETGQEVVVATADDFARYAETKDVATLKGNQAFFTLFKMVEKAGFTGVQVVDQNYSVYNRATHLGIRISEFPKLVENIDLLMPPTHTKTRDILLAYTDDLFKPNENKG